MPWTTTIDGKTGEQKTFWLDASFGCKPASKHLSAADSHHPVYEVTWITSRYSPERSSRKFDCGPGRESAVSFFEAKKRKRCQPRLIQHNTGTHEIA